MKSNDWRHKNVARYTPGNTKILYFFNCLLDGMHTILIIFCVFLSSSKSISFSKKSNAFLVSSIFFIIGCEMFILFPSSCIIYNLAKFLIFFWQSYFYWLSILCELPLPTLLKRGNTHLIYCSKANLIIAEDIVSVEYLLLFLPLVYRHIFQYQSL